MSVKRNIFLEYYPFAREGVSSAWWLPDGTEGVWCGNRRGVSLIAAVFVILILSFLGWVLVGIVILSARQSVAELFSAQAHYAAAGAAEAMVVLIDRGDEAGAGSAIVEIGRSRITVTRREEAPGYWRVVALGECGTDASPERARRRLELTFRK
jgi:hypothetical protein